MHGGHQGNSGNQQGHAGSHVSPFYDVDTVLFDCDSTLTSVEGIDELGRRYNVYDKLAALTRAAMEGELLLDEVFKRRLDIIKPNQSDIDWLGDRYVQNIISDAAKVISILQSSGKQLHIISGGIRQAVLKLAQALNITNENVHAVDLYFDDSGQYTGFDTSSPLGMSGGKASICRKIIGKDRHAVIVGDGITDLEAQLERVHFIGFGGVVCRPQVKSAAPDFILSLSSLLTRILTPEELESIKLKDPL